MASASNGVNLGFENELWKVADALRGSMEAEGCYIGRGVAAAPHKFGSSSYTYYFMNPIKERSDRFEAEITVFGSISKKDIHTIRHMVPPAQIVSTFGQLAASIDEAMENNDQQSDPLAALRDTLLPKLICGSCGCQMGNGSWGGPGETCGTSGEANAYGMEDIAL